MMMQRECLLSFSNSKPKFFHPIRTNTATLCGLGWDILEKLAWITSTALSLDIFRKSKIKNFITETSSGKIFKILVTVLLISFKQPSISTVLLIPPISSTLFTCFLYITMACLTDADFGKTTGSCKNCDFFI